MSFIFTETEGMVGAGAATAGLAATTAGLAGPAAAAAAVLPPGLDEISAVNAVRIGEHAGQVAAMLGMASTIKELYGTSVMMSGATYTLTDLMAQASIAAVAAV
jgi:hypothetical protein